MPVLTSPSWEPTGQGEACPRRPGSILAPILKVPYSQVCVCRPVFWEADTPKAANTPLHIESAHLA